MFQSIKEIGDRFTFKLNLDWNPARWKYTYSLFFDEREKELIKLTLFSDTTKKPKGKSNNQFSAILRDFN